VTAPPDDCLARNEWICGEYLSTRRDILLDAVGEHLQLTALSVLIGLAVAVPLAGDPGRAVDQNAFAVTAAYARQHDLRTLSDLGRPGLEVRLAAGDECVQRPYCEPGLKKRYGIDITGVDSKGVGTTQAKRAVQNGQDQMVLTTTTDATLDEFGLVLLADDRHLQNADCIVPVVNRSRAGSEGVTGALDRLNDVLTTADLASMNQQVDSWRRLPEDVARTYLEDKGLLK
jgi:osmoprotectant transport system substrate-binding protein